jgi:2',3'-cyclic-nucleotide 2'-phosphodiesterase / 3'-nucleotidase
MIPAHGSGRPMRDETTGTQKDVARAGSDTDLSLSILATSDLHAHLFPFNYYADRRDPDVGLSVIAALIQRARAECPNSLLFDNGDTLQGAPLADAALSELMPRGAVHPMIELMNVLGYDAATLGNHDFDFGLAPLHRALAGARYPVVLANADWIGSEAGPVLRHTILERVMTDAAGAPHRLRIGVTGAVPPQVMRWARAHLDGRIMVGDILPAIRREVAAMRAAGADLVIVLAHSGPGHDTDPGEGENVARLVARIDGVDAVIAGHTHRAFPGPQDLPCPPGQSPLVQPGCWGSHLGRIDLTLTRDRSGTGPAWRVAGSQVRLLSVADIDSQDRARLRQALRRMPVLRQKMRDTHRSTRVYAARTLGRTNLPLETYFSMIAPCAATQVIADAQRAAVARFIADRADLAHLPLISAATPFRAGGRGGPLHYTDVPAGPVLLRHAADLYGYSNGLCLLRANGAQLRDWLERSVSVFFRILPGQPGLAQPLIDPAFASYNFDRLDGLRYRIDLSQPARTNAAGDVILPGPGRIRDLCLSDGRPVADEDVLLVVTSAYRAAGGGHFPAAQACETLYETIDPVRDGLIAHICAHRDGIAPVVDPSFRFVPLQGAEVVVHTGPGAADYPGRIAALGLVPDGVEPDGFARYLMRI